ncbi:MAG TPA: hypothetical protein VLE73_05295 [Candidatus Saccharimonadales bacterium]|nr:hypothetical protein [Candidatus Saccharimonadales bacterium]
MDSLHDLLSRYSPKEPEEIVAIKRYIADEFNVESSVGIQGNALVITVQSASLANTLRMRLPALQAIANTNKRLVFRIG